MSSIRISPADMSRFVNPLSHLSAHPWPFKAKKILSIKIEGKIEKRIVLVVPELPFRKTFGALLA